MTDKKEKKSVVTLRNSQRGDTIISILMSMAVITLVIVLAYTLVTQSLRRGQSAREREQVKNLIQSQIEGLKNLAVQNAEVDNAAENIFHDNYASSGSGYLFCLKDDGTIHSYESNSSSTIMPYYDTPDPVRHVTNCDTFDLPLNRLWIEYKPKDADDNEQHLFTVTAEWNSAAGGPESKLSVPVRIHPLNQ